MSDPISQTQVGRKMPKWIIGAGSGIAVALVVVMIASGNNANAASRESLVAHVEEVAARVTANAMNSE